MGCAISRPSPCRNDSSDNDNSPYLNLPAARRGPGGTFSKWSTDGFSTRYDTPMSITPILSKPEMVYSPLVHHAHPDHGSRYSEDDCGDDDGFTQIPLHPPPTPASTPPISSSFASYSSAPTQPSPPPRTPPADEPKPTRGLFRKAYSAPLLSNPTGPASAHPKKSKAEKRKTCPPPAAEPKLEISWPTSCHRNPALLTSAIATGYPYPYPFPLSAVPSDPDLVATTATSVAGKVKCGGGIDEGQAGFKSGLEYEYLVAEEKARGVRLEIRPGRNGRWEEADGEEQAREVAGVAQSGETSGARRPYL